VYQPALSLLLSDDQDDPVFSLKALFIQVFPARSGKTLHHKFYVWIALKSEPATLLQSGAFPKNIPHVKQKASLRMTQGGFRMNHEENL